MWFYKFSKTNENNLGFKKEWGDFIINIEYPAGSYRLYKNNGKEERKMLYYDYGFIAGAEGIDGDSIDVYLGANKDCKEVYAVNQLKKDKTLDEYKYMLGFDSKKEARKAYLKHYPNSFFGGIDVIPIEKFKKNVKKSKSNKKVFKHAGIESLIKTASITFVLDNSHKIAQPKTISDLCYDFSNFCAKNKLYNEYFKSSANSDGVAPDGDSYDKLTGVMNIYTSSNGPKIDQKNRAEYDQLEAKLEEIREIMFGEEANNLPHKQREDLMKKGTELTNRTESLESWYPTKEQRAYTEKAIESWMTEMISFGFKMAYGIDNSNSRKGMVYRINITYNPTSEYPTLPELNMSNDNTYAILKTLGIEPDYSGQISLTDLKSKISKLNYDIIEKNKRKSTFEKTPEERTDTNFRAHIIDMGMSADQLDQRIQQLYEMADYGIKNGHQFIQWG